MQQLLQEDEEGVLSPVMGISCPPRPLSAGSLRIIYFSWFVVADQMTAVNNKLEMTWKEAVVAQFKVLFQLLF
jgi:hypothetical protein